MKRMVLVLLIIVAMVAPAFSQMRIDIGADVPRGIGAAFNGSAEISQETVDFFNTYFIPFPEAAFYYQFDLDIVKLGIGARAYTFILETIIWPNAFAELNLGRVALEAQVGGGLFGLIGLYNSIEAGAYFFPDISIWYKLGKKQSFRLGLGAMGLYMPDITTEGFGFVYYIGGKVALENL
ncbi:MAG: hypothetical protein CVV47_09475 [Spirochaetae bacterium HGW-Spirochaetae-3]|nr:MAG: hypothetical protein CVV47_09475 [Spirochaetae bacterium HGW-Spirochaetae-3]